MFGLLIAAFLVVTTVNGESVAIGQYKQQLLDVHNAYRGMQGAADMHALVCTSMHVYTYIFTINTSKKPFKIFFINFFNLQEKIS